MQAVKFPAGYQQVMPYLIINNATAFMHFMQDVFGAVEHMKHMREEGVIMHAEIKVGESIIMFADSTEQFGTRTGGFFIYVADADVVYSKAIEKGATALTAMSDQPYGRSGGVTDQFGNQWWITTDRATNN